MRLLRPYSILEFLEGWFSAGFSAIAAYHAHLGGQSLVRNLMVTHTRVPVWDLAVVLEGLSKALFEPIEEVLEKFLTQGQCFF